ncbi:hypothetical protein [Mucilaginibacter ginsenosidivorax]|uniref:Uncharacterized protein n=1 Tax=Mucilaginibacter ginsenosidivorax TaxID=862126 RepID=A0A5B8W240_9SPHI|nr:hypothetical protein [Mucilaginibacter ginsenosidivorax]QEC76398.1 hypothetical protein FSB76_10730 [Mucilaginibacter ginsenosidivorax]
MKSITDPHLIYAVADSKKNKITWTKYTADSEWLYLGEFANINRNLVIDAINAHFSEETLYVVTTRNGSRPVTKYTIEEDILSLLFIHNFTIWDAAFIQVIEFNKIGTMRCGQSLA